MKKTASLVAVMLALGLAMAGCSSKDEGAEETQGAMENSAGEMNHAATEGHDGASDPAADAGMMSEGAAPTEAAPAEPAPAEGQ